LIQIIKVVHQFNSVKCEILVLMKIDKNQKSVIRIKEFHMKIDKNQTYVIRIRMKIDKNLRILNRFKINFHEPNTRELEWIDSTYTWIKSKHQKMDFDRIEHNPWLQTSQKLDCNIRIESNH